MAANQSFAKFDDMKYENADELSKQIFSLPIHPWLKSNQIDFIIESINKFPNEK